MAVQSNWTNTETIFYTANADFPSKHAREHGANDDQVQLVSSDLRKTPWRPIVDPRRLVVLPHAGPLILFFSYFFADFFAENRRLLVEKRLIISRRVLLIWLGIITPLLTYLLVRQEGPAAATPPTLKSVRRHISSATPAKGFYRLPSISLSPVTPHALTWPNMLSTTHAVNTYPTTTVPRMQHSSPTSVVSSTIPAFSTAPRISHLWPLSQHVIEDFRTCTTSNTRTAHNVDRVTLHPTSKLRWRHLI